MAESKRHDWGLIVAGALLVLLAIFITAFPGLTSPSPWMIVYAVLDIIIGIMLLLHPIVFAGVVSWLVGIFVVAFGVIEVIGAVQLHKFSMPMWGWMVFSGIVDILCGVVFFVYPAMLAVFLAVFVIMRGVSLIMYGWRADSVLM